MPLYEFRCPQGHDFEKFYRSIGASQSQERCPECGEVAIRVMSAAGLVFKGSGFYITDYGKDGKKDQRDAKAAKPAATTTDSKPAEAPAKAAEATTPAPAAKAEAKPAAAPAPKASSTNKE